MPSKKLFTIPIINVDNFNKEYKPVYEFHISAHTRKKYDFDESLFSTNGNVIFANFRAARVFAFKMNEKRGANEKVGVGQVNAMGLLDEVYHYILRRYEAQVNPEVFKRALDYVNKNIGEEKIKAALQHFVELFPPLEVYKGNVHPVKYLEGSSEGKSNIEIALEELILLHFANFNPANITFKDLFDDSSLESQTEYRNLIVHLDKFFQKEKPYGPDNQFIFDLLKAPIISLKRRTRKKSLKCKAQNH